MREKSKMKGNWGALAITVVVSTLFLFVCAILPTSYLPDNLLAEVTVPLSIASLFSLIAGYVASRGMRSFRSGAPGGAINGLISLGLFLLAVSIEDRHFIALGGQSLIVWFPLVVLPGALLGMMGAGVRKLLRRAPKEKDGF
jgi:peptidoglycan/LPS O-acetylase OafA/YrhL